MKRKRYTEEKIISILKEHEAGASAPDLSRRHGVADNRKLKHLLAKAELDKAAMKEIIKGKW